MKARSTKNLQKLVSLVLGVAILIGFFKIDVWAADLSALLSMNAGAAEVIDSIDTMTMEEVTELATLDDEEEAEEKEKYNIVMARVNESMNIRELPDSGSEKVGLLYADCGGTILEEGDGWTKIQSGNLVGWAKNDYLVFGEAAYNLAQEVGVYEATVNASGLRMRKEPTTESGVWKMVEDGEVFQAIKEHTTEDWLRKLRYREFLSYAVLGVPARTIKTRERGRKNEVRESILERKE